MPKHDFFPRRQTGRADFPHPAFTQTLAPEQYVPQSQLTLAAKPPTAWPRSWTKFWAAARMWAPKREPIKTVSPAHFVHFPAR